MTSRPFLASFDVEEWFHAANLSASVGGADWSTLEGRVERNTHELLDILGEAGAASTFFVLGWVARRYPSLVRRIVDEGHEVASHTDMHLQLWSLSREDLRQELTRSRESLEQATGSRVLGVRAPNFSISEEVLDAMIDAGYWYDSSFFSLRAHGRYGRLSETVDPEAAVVEVRPGLLELPMSRLESDVPHCRGPAAPISGSSRIGSSVPEWRDDCEPGRGSCSTCTRGSSDGEEAVPGAVLRSPPPVLRGPRASAGRPTTAAR